MCMASALLGKRGRGCAWGWPRAVCPGRPLQRFLYPFLRGWLLEGETPQPDPFPSSLGEKVAAWPRAAAAGMGPAGHRATSSRAHLRGPHCLQLLPPFLHPRLGTKNFQFWLRCSRRGHQTTQLGSQGLVSPVWGKHACVCTHSPESLSSRQAAVLGGWSQPCGGLQVEAWVI